MLSFWEKETFLEYDLLIAGAGIVGLSTALYFKKLKPKARIAIVERGTLPSGASTKNAGFACFGSLTELLHDLETMGSQKTLSLVEERWKGLLQLRKLIGDQALDFHSYGGYELLQEDHLGALDRMEEVNQLLLPIFKSNVFSQAQEQIKDFGFHSQVVKAMVYNPFEGQLHPGKLINSLISMVLENGIRIYTGTFVEDIKADQNPFEMVLRSPSQDEYIRFRANKLAICTNAFARHFLPHEDIQAGRGMVLISKPLDKLPFQGVFHYDEGFYYFRNYGNRIVLGGGRNLDFQVENTMDFGINELIKARLLQDLKEIILPGQQVEIETVWSGIMGFGPEKWPILKALSEHHVAGVRLGGMGVAIGTRMGQRLAHMLLGKELP